jgi:DNA-binding ferritin-like protein
MSREQDSSWEATRSAWDEVGNRFADVGRHVGDQYRKLGEERGVEAQEEVRSSVRDAMQTVVRQLDQAFTSVGNALRDSESKQDLQRAARSLADAVSATFSDLSSELKQFGSPGSSGPSEPTGPSGPSEPPTPPPESNEP